MLSRPRLREKYALQASDLETLLRLLLLRSELVVPTLTLERCRDPTDDKFLEAAVVAKASHVVTGDADLLDLGSHEEIQIVSPADFVALID